MFLVNNCYFGNLSSVIEICTFRGSTESYAEISNCCFEKLTSSSSGHASAIFFKKIHSKIQKCLFDSCKCNNQAENNGANAIYHTNYEFILLLNSVSKCCEGKSLCDTAIYVYDATRSSISYDNFTLNNGAFKKSNLGSAEVEQYLVTNVVVDYVSSISGSADRAFLMSNGIIQNSNIVKFKGKKLIETVKKAIHCCFFDNEVSSYPTIPMENCISDDQKLSATITVFSTLEINFGNRICNLDKRLVNTNQVSKSTVIMCVFQLINLVDTKYFCN